MRERLPYSCALIGVGARFVDRLFIERVEHVSSVRSASAHPDLMIGASGKSGWVATAGKRSRQGDLAADTRGITV
jgi:hypothetical protein